MRPAAWLAIGVVALVAAAVLLAAAFTRFPSEAEPPGDAGLEAYERARYREAQVSVALGLAASFALLGGMACLQRARRGRSSP